MAASRNYPYSPINDEDVTPVSDGVISTISKRAKKNLNIIAICTIIWIVVVVILLFAVRLEYNSQVSIEIYNTSPRLGSGLSKLTLNDIKDSGFKIAKLSFGNAQCTIGEVNEKLCVPSNRRMAKIILEPTKTFQEVLGFGGAFTEAAAHNFFKLPSLVQKQFINLYFGKGGIGYTLGRIHINSCDFSLQSYNFDDVAGDYDLTYFDTEVTHDTLEIIPLLQLAIEASPRPIRLLASPWSPPAWMKATDAYHNASMLSSSTPNGLIDTDRIKATWSNYISKFITAYANKGINIWAITPQNEPEFPAPWEACAYTPSYQKDFVSAFLGPTLRQDHPDVLILGFDHNKDHLLTWSQELLNGHGRNFVDGMAFHWYAPNDDRYLDGTYGYDNVNFTYHMAPDKILLASEGCSCPGVAVGSLLRAERLAHDVLFDLNNGAQGWIDWNLLVDSEGGPNHLGNNCDAPLLASKDFDSLIVQPKFYYMGQISKWVVPGSIRIGSTIVGNYGFSPANPNVRPGFEIGVFACEQSARQTWYLNGDGTLQLKTLSRDFETKPVWTFEPLCVGSGYENRPYLNLVFCSGNETGTAINQTPINLALTKSGQLRVTNTDENLCIGLANGVAEAGALLNLQACFTSSTSKQSVPNTQRFFYESLTGEVWSAVPSGTSINDRKDDARLCLTAGWPFLTTSAFITPAGKTVILLLNEADLDTHIILSDPRRVSASSATPDLTAGDLWFGINGRSFQTIVY